MIEIKSFAQLGKSLSVLRARLTGHWCAQCKGDETRRISFNRWTWFLCPEHRLDHVEAAYIRAYLPPYNARIP